MLFRQSHQKSVRFLILNRINYIWLKERDLDMASLFIGICENINKDCEGLLQHLRGIANTLELDIDVRIYHTGTDFLRNYCQAFDIVILDMNVPDMSGEKIVYSLRNLDKDMHLILTSNTEDVFSIGYQYNANICWTKPLCYDKILNHFKKYLTYEFLINRHFILLSNNTGIQKLYCHKLRYIETGNRQLVFHYDGEEISNYGKLSNLEKQLPNENFFRCNNSYIVNIKYIEKISPESFRYKIHLITGEEIPLSRDKKNILVDMIKRELIC